MPVDYYEEEEYGAEIKGNTLRRVFALLKPHWRWAGFIISVIVVSILDAFFTFLGKQIVDDGILAGDTAVLMRILFIYAGLILVQSLAVFGFIYMVSIIGERIRYDLRQQLFAHLQSLSLSYYSRTPLGWIMARVTNDTERVAELVTWGILDSTWGLVNIATSMFFMVLINWNMALVVFAALPILLWVAIEFRKRILKQFRLVRKFNSKITASYNENITGVRVVKALGRENENLRNSAIDRQYV